ncbi:hypothetical protein SAMN00017477_1327 [Peptoniphilus asaccharolyticus DSM 20463]|uniref:Lipoprotein n=1 Tax=Peptoniphilus asaccharolyticus DSM 20463 TaxID=573058 RepID=A0A1W1V433_PEPAS|nr:hypothetical protein [Peptoniphilus asaccharolyticus]MBL7576274.1 hypothetical protein [Peptoniphilus asaccharolyticus]SMB88065.1 hypothetical protein SAMN00017477_1327 [Peptoniphilus asaccharolyticus DSM 20463]
MRNKKFLKIMLLTIIVMLLMSCSKQKDTEIKQENLYKTNNKIENLSDYAFVNYQNNSFIGKKLKDDRELYFLKLVDNNLEVVSKRREPQYIDYYGKYKDNNIMVYTEGDVLNIYTVDDFGNEQTKVIDSINSVATYDMDDYIVVNYNYLKNNEMIDVIGLISKADLEYFKIKEEKSISGDGSIYNLSGNVFSGVTAVNGRVYFQILKLKNESLVDNDADVVGSFVYDTKSKKEEKIDLSKRVNSFLVFKDMLIYNEYLKDKPSEQGSYIKIGDKIKPITLGDSANYFYEINEKEDRLLITSQRAIYCIRKNGSVEYIEKKFTEKDNGIVSESGFILDKSGEYDLIRLDFENGCIEYSNFK